MSCGVRTENFNRDTKYAGEVKYSLRNIDQYCTQDKRKQFGVAPLGEVETLASQLILFQSSIELSFYSPSVQCDMIFRVDTLEAESYDETSQSFTRTGSEQLDACINHYCCKYMETISCCSIAMTYDCPESFESSR